MGILLPQGGFRNPWGKTITSKEVFLTLEVGPRSDLDLGLARDSTNYFLGHLIFGTPFPFL